MDYELTVQSCCDWFDGEQYVYAAGDIILSEATASTFISDANRREIIDIVLNAQQHEPSYFSSQVWKVLDILEQYDQFAAIKAEITAHAFRRRL